MTEIEILTKKEEKRYTTFPIKYADIWEKYKKAESCFWKAQEIDFSKDWDHFQKLTESEQKFIKYILAFFAASDTIVNMNLEENFCSEITILEANYFYQYQAANENVHAETYSIMMEKLIKDKNEKKYLFNAIENIECIKEKKNWAEKWINNPKKYPLSQRLIAFAIVEGVFFSGSFCAIYWIKHKPSRNKENLMPGLTSSNEFIARDEGLHTDFACLLYSKYIKNKLDQDTVYEMFKEAIMIESKFITESLSCDLLGMNKLKMIEYIKFVADRLILELGYDKLFNINECPFDFMEAISMEGKTNFFESRPTQYQKSEHNNNNFELDDDF